MTTGGLIDALATGERDVVVEAITDSPDSCRDQPHHPAGLAAVDSSTECPRPAVGGILPAHPGDGRARTMLIGQCSPLRGIRSQSVALGRPDVTGM